MKTNSRREKNESGTSNGPKIQRSLSKKLFEKHYSRDIIDQENNLINPNQLILTIKLQGNTTNLNHIKKSYSQNVLERALEICFEVSKEFTVWMVKILIFNQLGDGFEPFSVTLYSEKKTELQSEDTMEPHINFKTNTIQLYGVVDSKQLESKSIFRSKLVVPSLSFAVGRGLSNAIVGYQTSFTIYSISKKGRFIPFSGDDKYQVIFEDEKGTPIDFHHETNIDKDGKTVIYFTPKGPGRFFINIMLKKEKICLAPYELHVLDVESNSSILKEMVFSGWDVEAAAILSKLSFTPMLHEKIFQMGLNILLHLLTNHMISIRRDMLKVFVNLFNFEENRMKVLKEGNINFLKAISKNFFWINTNYNFYSYIYRMLLFWLENSEDFAKEFIEEIGFDCLNSFVKVEGELETLRYVSKIYWRLSTIPENCDAICENPTSVYLLINLLQSFDHVIQRNVLATISNLTRSPYFTTQFEEYISELTSLIGSKDRQIRTDTMMLLSMINSSQITSAYIDVNVYLSVYSSLSIENSVLWLEIDMLSLSESDLESRNSAFSVETRETSDSNYATLCYLNNVISQADRSQETAIIQHFDQHQNGEVLLKICKLCGAMEERIQTQACILLQCVAKYWELRQKIINKNYLFWCVSSITILKPEKTLPVLTTLARFSISFPRGVKLKDNLFELLLNLAKFSEENMPEEELEHKRHLRNQALIIIGNLMRNEVERNDILRKLNEDLLNIMIQLAKSGEVAIHDQSANFNDFIITQEIAIGESLNKIYKGTWYGRPAVMKILDKDSISMMQREFFAEVFLMSLLSHKRIVSCLAASTKLPHLFVVTKLYSNGSVASLMNDPNFSYNFPLVIRMLIDAAKGIEYLHKLNVIHRDIKPGNFFVDENLRVSIADLGTARLLQKRMTPTLGTAQYMAPDIIQSDNYTNKIDVYSFGISMWEMIERRAPYPSISFDSELLEAVLKGDRPHFSQKSKINQLIESCWAADPADRPTFSVIISKLKTLSKSKNHSVLTLVNSSLNVLHNRSTSRLQSLLHPSSDPKSKHNVNTPNSPNSPTPQSPNTSFGPTPSPINVNSNYNNTISGSSSSSLEAFSPRKKKIFHKLLGSPDTRNRSHNNLNSANNNNNNNNHHHHSSNSGQLTSPVMMSPSFSTLTPSINLFPWPSDSNLKASGSFLSLGTMNGAASNSSSSLPSPHSSGNNNISNPAISVRGAEVSEELNMIHEQKKHKKSKKQPSIKKLKKREALNANTPSPNKGRKIIQIDPKHSPNNDYKVTERKKRAVRPPSGKIENVMYDIKPEEFKNLTITASSSMTTHENRKLFNTLMPKIEENASFVPSSIVHSDDKQAAITQIVQSQHTEKKERPKKQKKEKEKEKDKEKDKEKRKKGGTHTRRHHVERKPSSDNAKIDIKTIPQTTPLITNNNNNNNNCSEENNNNINNNNNFSATTDDHEVNKIHKMCSEEIDLSSRVEGLSNVILSDIINNNILINDVYIDANHEGNDKHLEINVNVDTLNNSHVDNTEVKENHHQNNEDANNNNNNNNNNNIVIIENDTTTTELIVPRNDEVNNIHERDTPIVDNHENIIIIDSNNNNNDTPIIDIIPNGLEKINVQQTPNQPIITCEYSDVKNEQINIKTDESSNCSSDEEVIHADNNHVIIINNNNNNAFTAESDISYSDSEESDSDDYDVYHPLEETTPKNILINLKNSQQAQQEGIVKELVVKFETIIY